MAAETGVLFALTLFQVVGAVVLLQRRDDEATLATRVMVALLILNATLTALRALRAENVARDSMTTLLLIVDLPSLALIAAFLFARSRDESLRRWTWPTAGVGVAMALLGWLVPYLSHDAYTWYFAVPYHVSVAALLVVTSRGETWERWIALAFLPRALYFTTQGLHSVAVLGVTPRTDLGLLGAQLVLGAACVVAIARLVRDARPPTSAIVVSMALVGPAVAFAQTQFPAPHSAYPTIQLLDFITLSLVRPLFLYVALAPRSLPDIVQRTAGGSAAGAVVAYGGPALLAWPAASSALLGLATALIVVSLWEALKPTAEGSPPPERSEGSPAPPSPAPAPQGARPHWQRILLELRGSSAKGPDGLGTLAWSQKEIARRTGISVKRVSEFPDALNQNSGQRLAAYVPGWKPDPRAKDPTLVEVHKGALKDAAGAWVYYRLTPLGERLAEAVALMGPRSLPSDPAESGRIPEPR